VAEEMSDARRTLKSAADLVAAGLVASEREADVARVGAKYAIALTPDVVALIDRNDANDPIARQFVPDVRELEAHPAELADPIGDQAKSPVPGLVHRYPDRVLLKIAHVCPVYCRFCFRREMVGPELGEAMTPDDLAAALAYIRARPQIWEVILTGGDPFVLSARRITEVTQALGDIPHVKILRWHTRVPVVDPARVTDDVVAALKVSSKTVFVGLHCNHARELTGDARAAIAKIVDAGIPVVSQTVLLKGVNDNAGTLETLMRVLVEARVKPYYLHHGDLAPGTAHFRTTIAEGQALMADLRRRLSGLALPTYVLDIPSAFGKIPLTPASISKDAAGYAVTDPNGLVHRIEDACAAPDVP
jgi:lysine 2,3-aminomutase